MIDRIIQKFKNTLYGILLFLLGIILVVSIIDLIYSVFLSISDFNIPIFSKNEITMILSAILLILIGIEFFDSIIAYFQKNIIHAEVIILVTLIAVARSIIISETGELSEMHIFGLGFLILAISASYYLIKRSHKEICN